MSDFPEKWLTREKYFAACEPFQLVFAHGCMVPLSPFHSMYSSPSEDQSGFKFRAGSFKPGGTAFLLLLLAGAGGYLGVSQINRPGEKPNRAPLQTGADGAGTAPSPDGRLRSKEAMPEGITEIRSWNAASRDVNTAPLTAPEQAGGATPGVSGGNALTSPAEPEAPRAAVSTRQQDAGPRFVPAVPAAGNAPVHTAGEGGLVTQAEVASLIGGLESSLTAVENALISEVFGENMPLLGNKLSQVANQALPALHQVTGLKTAVKNGLAALSGSATYTKAQVEQAITNALSAAQITIGGVTIDATNPADV